MRKFGPAILVALFAGCSGGGENTENEGFAVTAGETCQTAQETTCGGSTEGGAAVLICVAFDETTNKWTEQSICTKAQFCEESACLIDCDSAWVCEGRECGDDGCGGSCGGCPEGSTCLGGTCTQYACEPTCGAAQCGPDGCGGSCGECDGNDVCTPPGLTCQPKPAGCVPDCLNKDCGPNGCGGSCGLCPEGTFCAPADLTCQLPCTPDCTDRVCGDDGCGGSCGECADAGEVCISGQCGACDPVQNVGCPEGSFCTYTDQQGAPVCDEAGTQKYGEPCGGTDACAEGVCIELESNEAGGLCYHICETQSDCGEGNACIELADSVYKVCGAGAEPFETCNLLAQDCSLEADGCYFTGNANEPICVTAGTGQEGDSCSGQPNECAKGLTCVSVSGFGFTCRKFCNTQKGEEPSCDAGGEFPKCTNYLAAQKAGYCTDDQ